MQCKRFGRSHLLIRPLQPPFSTFVLRLLLARSYITRAQHMWNQCNYLEQLITNLFYKLHLLTNDCTHLFLFLLRNHPSVSLYQIQVLWLCEPLWKWYLRETHGVWFNSKQQQSMVAFLTTVHGRNNLIARNSSWMKE